MSNVKINVGSNWSEACLLTIVLILLKDNQVIDWPWWVATSPLWLSALFSVIGIVVVVIAWVYYRVTS